MDSATNSVVGQVHHTHLLIDDSLTRKGSISMDQNGNDRVSLGV